MSFKKIGIVILFLTATVLCFAQELKVTVIDRDLDFPLEGVALSFSSDPDTVYYTEFDGTAEIPFPGSSTAEVLSAVMPGYAEERIRLLQNQQDVTLYLSISEVIEGKELVVERKAPGKTDEKSGVSIVVDKRQMETTSRIGILPDIMTTIKTLPGMIYTGMWSAQPSVRGGYPEEMGTVLDGVYVLSPFHWGGSVSIFNPSMVENVKMSHGVFSSRYGRATSGLLDVSTIEPKSDQIRLDMSVSSITTDAFAQIPFTKKAALFIGGSLTYLDTIPLLYDALPLSEVKIGSVVKQMPFIRDAYAKYSYKPFDRLNLGANVFFGSEGLTIKVDSSSGSVIGDISAEWLDIQSFASLNASWLPTDKIQLKLKGAYNLYRDNITLSINNHSEDTDFDIKNTTQGEFSILGSTQLIQGKLDSDIQINQSHIIGFGVEEVFQTLTDATKSSSLVESRQGDEITKEESNEEESIKANNSLNSAGYVLWNFGNDSSVIQGELGLRGEHTYIWNTEKNFRLSIKPVVTPRFSMQWGVLRNERGVDKLTISLGSGLFSQIPKSFSYVTADYGFKDFELVPNLTIFQVVGIDMHWLDSWNFKIEGYYKYYFNRTFGIQERTGEFEYSKSLSSTGTGHITGFDGMIQKKMGTHFDGYISYSFNFARFYNHYESTNEYLTTTDEGDPLNRYYFPDFHRFNSLNLVFNWRPIPEIVVTLNTSFATGVPKKEELENGGKTYSDTLRTGPSYPVDLRFAYSTYFPGSKVKWDVYFGIEDIFGILNKESLVGAYVFGEEEPSLETVANFNFGLPIISIGGKISL